METPVFDVLFADYLRSFLGHHDTNNLSTGLLVTCPRLGALLDNLGGQVTNNQVDKLQTVKIVDQDRQFGQTRGGDGGLLGDRTSKNRKGGQLTNTSQGVKVDN